MCILGLNFTEDSLSCQRLKFSVLLFLNNLVLYLALWPLLYKSGIPEEADRDIVREINKVVSSWNRSSSRGLLPKIDRRADILNLPIRIAGHSNPVLVGEKSN